MTLESRRALVVCGDWALDSCGVGSSEAAMVAGYEPAPEIVDPLGSLQATAAAIGRASRARRPIVLVYPTASTVRKVRPLLGFLVAAVRRGTSLRIHLHEYCEFDQLRLALDTVMAIGAATVVVSAQGEAELIASSIARRRVRVHVIPPANAATPLATGPAAIDATGTGVVGVFGFHRPNKGIRLATEAIRALPARFGRLETMGLGWETAEWPDDIRRRVEIVDRGPLSTAELPGPFAGWELAVASFKAGATDGRNSLRSPLAHGIPTLTSVDRDEDLTLRPPHLVVVGDDVAAAVARATDLSTDDAVRKDGAAYVHDFERRARAELCRVLLGE